MEEKNNSQNHLKDILSIEAFRATQDEKKELYSRAYALPEFFLTNLVYPTRVVKCFTGKEALVEAFYYQLMKLALEVEVEGKNYVAALYQKFIKFDYIDEGELQDEIFTDFQYRKFIKDFIQIVQAQNIPNFQQTAEQFPIIDSVLRRIFRVIIPYPLLAALQSSELVPEEAARQLLTFLCGQFDITLSQVGPCFKLQESDMFVYLQSIDEIYVAFNDEFLQNNDEQSELSSTFKCGEGNSFASKYQSQTAGPFSDFDKTLKRFQKSRYWNKADPQTSGNGPIEQKSGQSQCQYRKNTNHSSQITGDVNEKQNKSPKYCEQKQQQTFGYVPPESYTFRNLTLDSNNSNQVEDSFRLQNRQKLYTEFTSSFILQKLSQVNKEQIRSIKDKYRPNRSSIRPLF